MLFHFIVIELPILCLYIFGPVRHINNTARMLTEYGENGYKFRERVLGQYWKVALYLIVVFFIIFMVGRDHGHDPDIGCLISISFDLVLYWMLLWPLITLLRSWHNRDLLAYWKEKDMENRIASGIARPGDVKEYIRREKQKAYDDGFSSGRLRWFHLAIFRNS
ncbi:MAG TPA: hypothetical protein DCY27_08085 [Desulfobacterales bacterium]|nr:hypothetical protein [Desulfobacterales bacterium]